MAISNYIAGITEEEILKVFPDAVPYTKYVYALGNQRFIKITSYISLHSAHYYMKNKGSSTEKFPHILEMSKEDTWNLVPFRRSKTALAECESIKQKLLGTKTASELIECLARLNELKELGHIK